MRPPRPRLRPARRAPSGRPGKILAMTVLMLPAMLGMLGMVLDGGLMVALHRQAQNAADAGAAAAAWDKLRGRSSATWTATANTYVKTYEGLANATVAVNNPPQSGYFSTISGNTSYIEVVVSVPANTLFIQAVGASGTQQVIARAVAGVEAVSAGEGAIVLDPSAQPGLSVSGGGNLVVNGRVVVNSQGGGVDENGQPVSGSQYAASASNGSNVQANDIQVVGGVNTPSNFQPLSGTTSPLHARSLPEPDPLINLPTPTDATLTYPPPGNGYPTITASGTYNPGIYSSIKLGTGTTATFNPGIYYIVPSKPGDGIAITGGASVTGNGVMFYLTGDNFNVKTGWPDNTDGSNSPPDTSGTKSFATVNISGQSVNLSGLQSATSPYNGMLFYQRRIATSNANNPPTNSVQGNGGATILGGTIYSKWGLFQVSGSGNYNAQFVVGSMAISGQSNIVLNYAGKNLGKANQVYLVE